MKINGHKLKTLINVRATEIEVHGAADLERRMKIERQRHALPPPMLPGISLIDESKAEREAQDELMKAEQDHFARSMSEGLALQAKWMKMIADLIDPDEVFDLSVDDLIRLNLYPSGKLGEQTTFGTRAIL